MLVIVPLAQGARRQVQVVGDLVESQALLHRPAAKVDGVAAEDLFALALGPLPGRAALAEGALSDATPRSAWRRGGWGLAEFGEAFHVFVLVPGGGGRRFFGGRRRVFFCGVPDTTGSWRKVKPISSRTLAACSSIASAATCASKA